MIDIRLVEEEEMEEAVRLSNATFRDGEQISMGESFADAFSPALRQSYGAFHDGKLVSFVGLVPSVVHIGPARLNVYSVGSVCTDAAYRGQGLASRILEHVRRHADRAGASLLLVSGNRSLYERMQCYPFGSVAMVELDGSAADRIVADMRGEHYRIRDLEPTDWLALTELAARRTVRFDQSVTDAARLIRAEAHSSCMKLRHTVTVAEKNGTPAAFLVAGLPYHDKVSAPPLTVEWAGEPNAVAALMASLVRANSLSKLRVCVSWFETELLELLAPVPERKTIPNLGTIHVVDPDRLFKQLEPYLIHKNAACSQVHAERLDDQTVKLTVGERSCEVSSEAFVSLLFNPGPVGAFDEQSAQLLTGLFPVPFPYAGGLNYV